MYKSLGSVSVSIAIAEREGEKGRKMADQLPPQSLEFEDHAEKGEENDNPIEQVRLIVSTHDDPDLPALTFRTWVLGMISCGLLAFLNRFFGFRENALYVSTVAAQIVTLPLGKLMAATLPTRVFTFPVINWKFTLNPGPFNMKEHVLITIFASNGENSAYAMHIITSLKAFYHRNVNIVAAYLLMQTTMLFGYGWAGIYRKILVDSPYMWWPENLIQVSLFRSLHDEEKRQKGGVTRLQFFLMVFITSFAYYVVPGYLFPSLSAISIACLIWKKSILAQQIGSGLHGLGIGSFALDWNAVVSFLGNPIAAPGFAIINILVGFFIFAYVIIPAAYFSNIYEAKKFPFFSSSNFDSTGQRYNISRVLQKDKFALDAEAYNNYSKLYLSSFFIFSYGLSFATLTATFSHVIFFYGKTIWDHWMKTAEGFQKSLQDVHTRTMKKNYPTVPSWWFHGILVIVFGLSLLVCEGFGKQIQLPWWGLILACGLAFLCTLPIGIIQALTSQQTGLNVITEFVIGFLYPGRPVANVTFKTYGYISMSQALYFLRDFKLGHYMKIPPRSMFFAQLVGTVVSCLIQTATAWWLLSSVDHICDPSQLPEGSPWTCPGDSVFYSASIIWGVIGPRRMFTDGVYPKMLWFFFIGALAPLPVYLLSRKYPEKKWITLINMPLILGGTSNMPPARSLSYLLWGTVGIFFNVYIYRKYKKWWAKHTYVLAAALDAGIAFMGILLYMALQSKIPGPNWWGLDVDDHCPLATCPTAPGVVVEGCPVF